MEYIKSEQYQIKKNAVARLLGSFYYATDIPVWLYTTANSILISMPDHIKPIALTSEQLEKASLLEETYIFKQNNSVCIAAPITTIQGIFGYLYVEMSQQTKPAKVSGIQNFMELIAKDIVQDNLIILEYQRYVDQFKKSLWDLLDRDLSINTLCGMLGIGKTKLASDFQKYVGTSVAKFILNMRIEKARYLLTTADLSITEISEKVGFNDYNYFCRVFRKYNGISPQNYRIQKHYVKS